MHVKLSSIVCCENEVSNELSNNIHNREIEHVKTHFSCRVGERFIACSGRESTGCSGKWRSHEYIRHGIIRSTDDAMKVPEFLAQVSGNSLSSKRREVEEL
jgi:hypothetical protein